MSNFSKKRSVIEIGQIVLGFGLIFFGLDIMKDAFGPVKKSEATAALLASFSRNPLLGVFVGTVITMIFQSSSATIAIVQLLAFNGVISFDAAIPLILGDNIGTTITAQLASIGTNLNSRRAARAHALFNIAGVCIILPFVWLGLYGNFIEYILPGEITSTNIMVHIAVAHCAFNVINAIIFTLAVNYLLKAAISLTKEKKEESEKAPKYLQEHLIRNPSIALDQVIKELIRMAEIAKRTVENAQKGFFNNDEKLLNKALEDEEILDDFQQAITQYLVKISEKNLFTRESKEYPILLHSVNDLEKVGDYAQNVVNYARIKSKKRLVLHEDGIRDINAMFDKLYELFDCVIVSLKTGDHEMAMKAIAVEDEIDDMKAKYRESHISRMMRNQVHAEAGTMTMDLAINVEKMGDHLISIAKAVIKDLQWGEKISIADEDEEDDS
jgi:phosphate:Na+ symporter